MNKFDQKKLREEEEMRAKEGQPDNDGWITVTKQLELFLYFLRNLWCLTLSSNITVVNMQQEQKPWRRKLWQKKNKNKKIRSSSISIHSK